MVVEFSVSVIVEDGVPVDCPFGDFVAVELD